MIDKLTVRELSDTQVQRRRALVRVDYNVPLDDDGEVADDARIHATLPTLEYLRGREARVVLMSHLGRPKGEPSPEYSLRPVARHLGELIGEDVRFVPSTVSDEAVEASNDLQPGQILVVENTRFDPGETENDKKFAGGLATLGDVYVNDAFGSAHRAHASTVGVTRYLRPAVAGLLMERELEHLGGLLAAPEKPFVAILGGAKVSGKLDLIEVLLEKVDRLCIGGAMASTFFKAMGLDTGRSLVEEELVGVAGELMERAGDALVLPDDVVVAPAIEGDAHPRIVNRGEIPGDQMVLDIGPQSARRFAKIAADSRTILWNGPVGVFEYEPFQAGTRVVAHGVVEGTRAGARSVVGGGDTAAAVNGFGLTEQVTHVSTGGGATLEFLAGKDLPGVTALTDRE